MVGLPQRSRWPSVEAIARGLELDRDRVVAERTRPEPDRMQGHVFVENDVLTAPASSYSEQVTLDLAPAVSITLPMGLLKGYALLAYTEPMRRRTDGVWVPKTWLVGERVGY